MHKNAPKLHITAFNTCRLTCRISAHNTRRKAKNKLTLNVKVIPNNHRSNASMIKKGQNILLLTLQKTAQSKALVYHFNST